MNAESMIQENEETALSLAMTPPMIPHIDSSEEDKQAVNCVKVYLRIRPNPSGSEDCIVPVEKNVVETLPEFSSKIERYRFDRVFNDTTDQTAIFEETTMKLMDQFIEGKNALLFSYGVTNAGKTYTIEGTPQNPGIIPQSLEYLYSNSNPGPVHISYLQVYNEQVHDLQQIKRTKTKKDYELSKCNIKIKNNKVVVENLQMTEIKSPTEALKILKKCRNLRSTNATALNSSSSRSHSVFGIHLNDSSFFIVDLAGSERSKRTNPTRLRQQEASSINKSLMNLMACLDDIRHNQSCAPGKKRLVPFRSSKLTMIFKNLLLGRNVAGIHMIVNASAAREDFNETLHSLKYSAIARKVKLQSPVKVIEKMLVSKNLQEVEAEASSITPVTPNMHVRQSLVADIQAVTQTANGKKVVSLKEYQESCMRYEAAMDGFADKVRELDDMIRDGQEELANERIEHTIRVASLDYDYKKECGRYEEKVRKIKDMWYQDRKYIVELKLALDKNNIEIPDQVLPDETQEQTRKRKSAATPRGRRSKTMCTRPNDENDSTASNSIRPLEARPRPRQDSVGKDSVMTTSSLKRIGSGIKKALGFGFYKKKKVGDKTVEEIIATPVSKRTRTARRKIF